MARHPVIVLVVLFAAVGALLGGVALLEADSDAKDREAQRRDRAYALTSCEATKAGRLDLARVWGALTDYYDGVLMAASVREDVKRAATKVRDAVHDAEVGARSRVVLCLPLVDEGRRVPDEDALASLPEPSAPRPPG